MEERKIITRTSDISVNGRKISGTAVVFNSLSVIMRENNRVFRERILPGAITGDTLMKSDIRALVDHDKSRLLARSNKMQGSLHLDLDSTGLRFFFEAPNTADGDYAVELIKRKDIDGCSFSFSLQGLGADDWQAEKDGTYIRTIKRIYRLYDVTLTADPAYPATTVGVRKKQGDTVGSNVRKEKQKLLRGQIEQLDYQIKRAAYERAIEQHNAIVIGEALAERDKKLKQLEEIRQEGEKLKKDFEDLKRRMRGRPKRYYFF